MLSFQVCPDKIHNQDLCSIRFQIASGRGASLCGIALSLTHCMASHTYDVKHNGRCFLCPLPITQLALTYCELFAYFANQPRCTVLSVSERRETIATELSVPVQWLFAQKCHINCLVPHTLFRLVCGE